MCTYLMPKHENISATIAKTVHARFSVANSMFGPKSYSMKGNQAPLSKGFAVVDLEVFLHSNRYFWIYLF